jgi:hypothetical protein
MEEKYISGGEKSITYITDPKVFQMCVLTTES